MDWLDTAKRELDQIRSELGGATLIAVSKKQPTEKIRALYGLGHRDFGENYVQELLSRSSELSDCPELRWHFIGHLQRKKVKSLLTLNPTIHSIDSLSLAEEINKRADRKIEIFLQVNIDLEETKSGVLPGEAKALAEGVRSLENLDCLGLMCIPKAGGATESKGAFSRLKKLSVELGDLTGGKLSMGMSADYKEALASGSTHIRVGTRLFGPRE